MNAEDFSKHLHVILIGVNEVRGCDLPLLESPVKDVERLAAALRNSDGCAVSSDNLVVLTGNSATREACIGAIDDMAKKVTADDLVLIYFSGHGLRDGHDFYLCNCDAVAEDLPGTAVSASQIDELFLQISARGLLLLLDCCKSAGFAEFAPGFFRQLDDKDFKILLSASRANELSWERKDGQGSLFSYHLAEVIEGKKIVGDTPGLIYFSELLHFIQYKLKEDFETLFVDVPVQEPVFAGTYVFDPLLFVHKGLTLQQVRVKTKRYSKEYIRRLVYRGIAWTLSAGFLLCGFTYTLLENYEYVRAENRTLVSYQGLPGLQLFGFPKKVWQYDFALENLRPSSLLLKGAALTGSLGGNADTVVYGELRPVYQAAYDLSSGQTERSRKKLRECLTGDASVSVSDKVEGLQLLSCIALPADTDIYHRYEADPDDKVRGLALTGLGRFNTGNWVSMAENDHSLHSNGIMVATELENRIIANARGCSTAISGYRAFILKLPYNFTRRLALENAWLQHCPLPDDAWLGLLQTIGGDDWNNDLDNYFKLLGADQRQRLAAAFTRRLPAASSLTEQKYLLKLMDQTVGLLPEATLEKYLAAPDTYVQFQALELDLRQGACPGGTLVANLKKNARCLGLLARYGYVGNAELLDTLKKTNSIAQREIIEQLAFFKKAQIAPLYPALASLLLSEKTYYDVKLRLIGLLKTFDFDAIGFESLFRANEPGVRSAAWNWFAQGHERETRRTLLSKLNSEDPDVLLGVLATRRLDRNELAALSDKVLKQPTPAAAGVALLALNGDLTELRRLLESPDAAVRRTVINYGAANPFCGQLLKDRQKMAFTFREAREKLASQHELVNKLIAELKNLPVNLRYWQLLQLKQRLEFADDPEGQLTAGAEIAVESALSIRAPDPL